MDVFLQQTINGIALGGMYAMLALGLAIVFSILRMINFAHGELMTVAGYGVYLGLAAGLPFLVAIVPALLCSVVLAVLMERIAFRPFRNASGVTLLITSFALSTIIQIVLQNIFSPRPKAIALPAFFSDTVSLFGLTLGVIQLLSILVTATMLGLLLLFLRSTTMGTAMRAAAENFDVTRLMGVRANRVIATAFAASGLLAGVAGLLWIAQRSSVDPMMGFVPVLKSFIAVILGGLGSLSGAVLGGFMLGLLEVYFSAYLPQSLEAYRDAFVLLSVIMLLLGWPEGLETVRLRRSPARA